MPFITTFDVNPASQSQFAKDEADRLALPPLVPSYPGHSFVSAALAGGVGETASLPGPSAGYIRVYTTATMCSTTIGTGLTSAVVTLEPQGYTVTAAQSGTATLIILNPPAIVPLAFGESLKVTNGGAGAGCVCGTYVDLPAAGITVLRTALDATGVEVIPAAPTGYACRFLQLSVPTSTGFNVRVWNADAITQSFEILVGGTVLGRSAPVLTTAQGSLNGPTNMLITSTPMLVKCTSAVNTTAPRLLYAYETMPLAA